MEGWLSRVTGKCPTSCKYESDIISSRGIMITIKFTNADTELEALGFLLGRFPGRVLKTGEVFVPDAALQALVLEG